MDDFGMKTLVLAEAASSIAWKPIVGIYSQIAELRSIGELSKACCQIKADESWKHIDKPLNFKDIVILGY